MKKAMLIAVLAALGAAGLAAQQGGRRWTVTSSVNVNGVEVTRNGYTLGPNGYAPGAYGQGYPQNGAAFPSGGYSPNGYASPPDGYAPGAYGQGYPQNGAAYPPGGYSPNGGGTLPVNAAAVAITGKISSAGGTPAVVSGNKVYFLPVVAPYIDQIEGYQEGVEITVEGYAAPDGGYMELSKLTLGGKVYFFLKAASQGVPYGGNAAQPGSIYGAPPNGYAAPPGFAGPPVNLYVSPPQNVSGNGY
jgi:hypothetical protein